MRLVEERLYSRIRAWVCSRENHRSKIICTHRPLGVRSFSTIKIQQQIKTRTKSSKSSQMKCVPQEFACTYMMYSYSNYVICMLPLRRNISYICNLISIIQAQSGSTATRGHRRESCRSAFDAPLPEG